jgi:hypothetical protein
LGSSGCIFKAAGRVGDRETAPYKHCLALRGAWLKRAPMAPMVRTLKIANLSFLKLGFLVQRFVFGCIIARLYVMGGASTQLRMGWQVFLPGRKCLATPAFEAQSRKARRRQLKRIFP